MPKSDAIIYNTHGGVFLCNVVYVKKNVWIANQKMEFIGYGCQNGLVIALILLCIIFLNTFPFSTSIVCILIAIQSCYIIWLIMRTIGESIQLLEEIKRKL